VDWLYFTGKLPADPLGRLFSTMGYARQILFSEKQPANEAIDRISRIHRSVEQSRGERIPDWAYRDVLYMLIDYSIRAYAVLEREPSATEKEEIYEVFKRVGERMQIGDLPDGHEEWLTDRGQALSQNYENNHYTADLFIQYRKHLGPLRFFLLKQVQAMMSPQEIRQMLNLELFPVVQLLFLLYKISRRLKADEWITGLFMPLKYKGQIRNLSSKPAAKCPFHFSPA
ncbi:MAG: DUF2236 domain-containing protein, partial [Mucilaginibacter polytrichastri]|nr:DUF2236 domain-containing protein [Mucilaginibacter polytrichastri]